MSEYSELVGERVVLRVPVESDAAELASAVSASLDDLAPWMPWATPDYDETGTLGFIRGEFGDAHRYLMIDPATGDIVGVCGLNKVDELNRSANLGYWVRSDRVGRGYATEAARLLARFGLTHGGYERLEIQMSTLNHASRRVAEKAGAIHEGVRRSALLLLGERHDAHMWSFVRADAVAAGSDTV